MIRSPLSLPAEVMDALDRYLSAEFTTFSRAGVPVTVAVGRAWLPRSHRFLVTCGIGLPRKVYNAQRNPKVSLLFSNPAGTGLASPPPVLVQGEAVTSDVVTWDDELAEFWGSIWSVQPQGKVIGSDPVSRRLMDWYYLRLKIHVVPRRIRWWPDGDMTRRGEEVELG